MTGATSRILELTGGFRKLEAALEECCSREAKALMEAEKQRCGHREAKKECLRLRGRQKLRLRGGGCRVAVTRKGPPHVCIYAESALSFTSLPRRLDRDARSKA